MILRKVCELERKIVRYAILEDEAEQQGDKEKVDFWNKQFRQCVAELNRITR